MQEQEIRLTTVVAIGLWSVGVGLVIIGMVTDSNGVPGLGVLLGMVAVVIQIRGFFADHEDYMRRGFELGRDFERSKVRSLH